MDTITKIKANNAKHKTHKNIETQTKAVKAAIEKAGLKVATRDDFKDGQSLENFNDISRVTPMALVTKAGEVAKEPIFNNGKYLLFAVTKRNDPSNQKYNEQANAVEERLLEERRSMTYEAYIENIKKKMKTDGKITVYKEVVEKIFQEMAAPPVQ